MFELISDHCLQVEPSAGINAAEQPKIIHSHAADALASAIAEGTSTPSNRRKPHGKALSRAGFDVFDVSAPMPDGEAQPQLQVWNMHG